MGHTLRLRAERHTVLATNAPESGRVIESSPGKRFTSDLLSRESVADHHGSAELRTRERELMRNLTFVGFG